MPLSSQDGQVARQTLIVAGIAFALASALFLFWQAAQAFFIIFAGLVLAATFCGLSRSLQRLGLPPMLALGSVYLLLVLLLGGGFAWGGITLVEQFNALVRLVSDQLNEVLSTLKDWGVTSGGAGQSQTDQLQQLLPNAAGLFSSASQTAFGILGAFSDAFFILFIAVFVSWQPELYRRGIVSLVPKARRARVNETLWKAARELMLWLAGQAISMSVIFVVSWIGLALIGMPSAFLLALQAGLLAFVPTLGPFVAGVVIVLAGFSDSTVMALWGLGVYLVIQGVESNIAQPVAQRWTSALPPALTLSAQLIFGLLFGLMGVAMAVPVVAVAMIFVQELYVQDSLGGPYREPEPTKG
nr:AI-2E family transporter [Aurantimonas sp. CSK15Z-1]